jgi:RimJ/RimL family protein N-acetyltransferase
MGPALNPSSARLRLYPLASGDARELATVLADPRLYRHTGGEPLDEAGLRARFTRLETRRSPDGSYAWQNWTVRLCEGDQAVGYVQATVDSSSAATIAYVIGTAWQGRGLASEAVRAMIWELRARGVREVKATIPPGHKASARVAAAVGLRRTGALTSSSEEIWVLEDPPVPARTTPPQ